MAVCFFIVHTFVLLTPDCVIGEMVEHLVHRLVARTQSLPVCRFRCRLSSARVVELYPRVFDNVGRRDGSLILELFQHGSCEVLVWPAHFHERLAQSKGATHPADATADSLRGSYPIDSSVCNLLHVSDNKDAAAREFEILARAERLTEPWRLDSGPSIPPSGILTICRAFGLASLQVCDDWESLLDASSAYRSIAKVLIDTQQRHNQLAGPINAYFRGDPDPLCELAKAWGLVNHWQDFLMRCGSASAQKWKLLLLDVVIFYISDLLPCEPMIYWVIGGSVAARQYGDKLTPSDIDVRCSEEALDAICRLFNLTSAPVMCDGYRSRIAILELGAWAVEFSADLIFYDGRRVSVDKHMVERRTGIGYQSREDILAELISLKRPHPKCDWERVERLYHSWHMLDNRYLAARLKMQGETQIPSFERKT